MEHKAGGFTLMELMIAILIVGILVGVAIPKYLQAVDKSKFSSLQPITRKVQAIQEQYYLSNNRYAEELEDLDIDLAGTVNGKEVKSSEGVIVGIEEEGEEYQYVKGEKENFNNRYIAYQVHSENFGGDTHCEAKQGDNRADKLCKAIGGEYIGEHGEWLAYRLTGSGIGSFSKECSGSPEIEGSCSCGTKTREASCNEKSGEYEYGEWSECPTQPATEQSCSTGTGTETREVTCKENSWVTGEWDTSNCKKECDASKKPAETNVCGGDTCGVQTRSITCDTSSGSWKVGEWEGNCESRPANLTKSCGSEYTNPTGTQYVEAKCSCPSSKQCYWVQEGWVASMYGGWQVYDEKDWWNTAECGCSMSAKPTETEPCGDGYTSDSYKTKNVECRENYGWEIGDWNYDTCTPNTETIAAAQDILDEFEKYADFYQNYLSAVKRCNSNRAYSCFQYRPTSLGVEMPSTCEFNGNASGATIRCGGFKIRTRSDMSYIDTSYDGLEKFFIRDYKCVSYGENNAVGRAVCDQFNQEHQ